MYETNTPLYSQEAINFADDLMCRKPKDITDFNLEDLFHLRQSLYTQDGKLFIRVKNHLEEVSDKELEALVLFVLDDMFRYIGKRGKIKAVTDLIKLRPPEAFEVISSSHKQLAFKNGIMDAANWTFTYTSGFDGLDALMVPTYTTYELNFDVVRRLFEKQFSYIYGQPWVQPSETPQNPSHSYVRLPEINGPLFADAKKLYNNCVKDIEPILDKDNNYYYNYSIYAYIFNNLLFILHNTPTPTADKFFKEIADGNNDVIERIYQMIGYILVPGNEAKAYFLLQGEPNSGKTILGNFLEGYFPNNKVTSLDIKRLGGQFLPDSLSSSCLNLSMDLPNGRLSPAAVAVLKMLTGNDLITQEVKFKDAKPYRGHCKFIFSTNFDLEMQEYDEAFLNRTICIPFKKSIPKDKQDPDLLEKLNEERPAITAKALACYYFLRANNFKFAGSDTIKPNVKYRMDPDDAIKAFVQEKCEFTYSDKDKVSTNDLHDAYLVFCRKNNMPAIERMASFSQRFNFLFRPTVKHLHIDKNTYGYAKIKLYIDPIDFEPDK